MKANPNRRFGAIDWTTFKEHLIVILLYWTIKQNEICCPSHFRCDVKALQLLLLLLEHHKYVGPGPSIQIKRKQQSPYFNLFEPHGVSACLSSNRLECESWLEHCNSSVRQQKMAQRSHAMQCFFFFSFIVLWSNCKCESSAKQSVWFGVEP